ncbi:GH32 C-terminal domain-containing protein [Paenibacillus sp. MAH-36]|uniref:GH32 C-terminal domain-containing protein n=1 Tax=Paenibacillus violae TaxID=3077234 RepID=A0ABU3RN22_9BACL|nr:GH32 C-terminal domain-containing protein [Paenibacillus sp. PFR10]MDU0205404.1 GH32 C-terminal domain-containing protein [Paenibacillus sp. PFR10]
MRKKVGLRVAGSASIILLVWGVTALLIGDGKSKESVEETAFSYVKDPTYYTEKFRPQYHLSPETGNMSDPNGMVYFEGEYHQFYQNSGQWGHAVSRDMIHWEHLPVALARDALGEIWSGSAVVDTMDTSGFFGGKAGLVAIFTHFKSGLQSQSIAYSTDKGRTWTKYEGNPVISNPGLKDFRDPKVIWHEQTKSWVMVVSADNRVQFYTSPDLKTWKLASEFGSDQGSHAAVWECPDLFELPVEGTKTKKWVLAVSIGSNNTTKGSTTQYFVGTFDGHTFQNDNPASDVLWTDYGKDFYAAVSFSNIPAKDGRRIWLGWMSNWRYPFAMPTGAWKGNMSIPRELGLKNIPDQGLRLIQEPIHELQTLRGKEVTFAKQQLTAGVNPFINLKGTTYELISELTVQPNSLVEFQLRKGTEQATKISYDADAKKLTIDRTHSGITSFEKGFAEQMSAPMKLRDGKLKLHFFVDEGSLEVFANDGEAVISSLIFPDATSNRLELTATKGNVTLDNARFYPMGTVWREEDVNSTTPQRVVLNKTTLDVPANGNRSVEASIVPLSGPQELKWTSSDEDIVTVSVTNNGAKVKGVKAGQAEIKATSQDGTVVSSLQVYVFDSK